MEINNNNLETLKRGAQRQLSIAAFCVWLVAISANEARAQVNLNTGPGYDPYNELITETVAQRMFSEQFDISRKDSRGQGFAPPPGFRMGLFTAAPYASAETTFDDNIFRSNTNSKSDLKTTINGGVQIKSSLPRHQLDFSLNGRIVNYLEHSDQNHESYDATLRGALHFDHAHTLSASLITALVHEEIGDDTAPLGAAEPVPVFRHRASFGITRDAGRLHGTLSGRIERLDYKDVRANNGTLLDQDHRDLDTTGARLRVGYRVSPAIDVLGSISGDVLQNEGKGTLEVDGNQFDIRGGVGFEVGPLLEVELLAGYGFRNFDSVYKQNIKTSVFSGRALWRPTRRTTVRANIGRNISDSPDANGSTFITTEIGGSVRHEIYHNIFATGGLHYRKNEFTETGREDDIISADLGLQYRMSKNVNLFTGYQFVQRDSTNTNFDSTNNRFTVGARLQF